MYNDLIDEGHTMKQTTKRRDTTQIINCKYFGCRIAAYRYNDWTSMNEVTLHSLLLKIQ